MKIFIRKLGTVLKKAVIFFTCLKVFPIKDSKFLETRQHIWQNKQSVQWIAHIAKKGGLAF